MYSKKNARYYHAMLLPGMVFLIVFFHRSHGRLGDGLSEFHPRQGNPWLPVYRA